MKSKMYYVTHEGLADFNCDLFVEAQNEGQAFNLWSAYCKDGEWEIDEEGEVSVMPVPEETGIVSVREWDHTKFMKFTTEGYPIV